MNNLEIRKKLFKEEILVNQKLRDIHQHWEQTGRVTRRMAVLINAEFDPVIDRAISRANAMAYKRPMVAFGILGSVTSFINAAIQKAPEIFEKYEDKIITLTNVLRIIAWKLGADSISISLGFPLGISIGLSFPITNVEQTE